MLRQFPLSGPDWFVALLLSISLSHPTVKKGGFSALLLASTVEVSPMPMCTMRRETWCGRIACRPRQQCPLSFLKQESRRDHSDINHFPSVRSYPLARVWILNNVRSIPISEIGLMGISIRREPGAQRFSSTEFVCRINITRSYPPLPMNATQSCLLSPLCSRMTARTTR